MDLSGSKTKVGWTAGAGVEYAVTQNFTVKAEYLYVDLGDVTANVSGGVGTINAGITTNCYGGATCRFYRNPASGTVTSDFAINIARLGVNYKF